METQQLLIRTGISVACIVVFTWVWKLFNLVWITPKTLEKKLREQGLSGNPYRLLHGDIKESTMMSREALSKPMVLFSNDHISRIMPYPEHIIKKHGNCSFMWQGPVATVFICEPELMREVLNKIDAFRKPKANPLAGILAPGFIQYDGEKWSKHRKLVTPAFYTEMLEINGIPDSGSVRSVLSTEDALPSRPLQSSCYPSGSLLFTLITCGSASLGSQVGCPRLKCSHQVV